MQGILSFFSDILLWMSQYVWLFDVIKTFILFTLMYRLTVFLLKKIHTHYNTIPNRWIVVIGVQSIRKPVRYYILFLCIVSVFNIIVRNTMLISSISYKTIFNILFALFILWSSVRFIKLIQNYMLNHKTKMYDKTSVLAFGQIGMAIVVVVGALSLLQTLGVNLAGLLAFGGFSGIAVGFAAKDLLANFFGAVMIYLDKPFKVGDWIRSPEKDIEGDVESIGWRQTKIMTFEKRPIYVPNSFFSTIVIENASRMTHRRFNEIVGIRYDDISQANNIVDGIKSYLLEHPKIDNSQSLVVGVVKFAASSVDIMIYCFTTTSTLADFSKVRHEILLSAANIIAKHNAQIAFPTSTVYLNPSHQTD